MDETTTQSRTAAETTDVLAFDAVSDLEVGDRVRVPEHTDQEFRVTHLGDVVVGLHDNQEGRDDTTALVESTDGRLTFVSHRGVLDVADLEILPGEADTDGGQDPLAALPRESDAAQVVEVAAVEDGRLVLEGDTYPAKESIKCVSYGARAWDGDRKVWLVDVDALENLREYLEVDGFGLVDARPTDQDEGDEDGDADLERLESLAETLEEGDRIRVEYAQKNGEGENEKEGVVRQATPGDDEYPPFVAFVRDDGQTMRLKLDNRGDLALFTGGYAPYVGDVGVVEILE